MTEPSEAQTEPTRDRTTEPAEDLTHDQAEEVVENDPALAVATEHSEEATSSGSA